MNRLVKADTPRMAMSPQEWVDQGNAHLAQIGRGHEVHWYLHNGRPCIGWRK